MISWIVLLLVGGVVLILAEFILPGLICGIVGACMIFGSMFLTAREYPAMAVPLITGEAFGAVALTCLGLYIISRTGGFTGLTLKTAQNVEDGYINVATDTSLVGKTGVALTTLRPSGTIEVDGRRLDAVTDGVFVDSGATVRVVEVHGNRIVIEPGEEA